MGSGSCRIAPRRSTASGRCSAELAASLGLPGEAELRYRPRSAASDADGLAAELAERRQADLDRGFTAHGPHRDELQLLLGDSPLRAYGSQGQQRAALLALLFAERALLSERRARLPLMLLDDVMSELDSERRELLAELLRSGGQAVVTTTEPEHVPGTALATGGLIRVEDGSVRAATRARWPREAARPAGPVGGSGGNCPGRRARHAARPRSGGLGGGRGAGIGRLRGPRFGARRRGHGGLRVGGLGAGAGVARPRSAYPFRGCAGRRVGAPGGGLVKKLRFVVGLAPNQ